jgi:cysteine desulfurase
MALVVRRVNRDFDLKPLQFGGEQERGLRPGTLNVPGIVGLGEACHLALLPESRSGVERLREWQQRIYESLKGVDGVRWNGPEPGPDRLCNNLSFSFRDVAPDELPLALAGLAYSSGSACNSSQGARGSHVLQAMGVPLEEARTTVRLGLGRATTATEVSTVIERLLSLAKGANTSPARPTCAKLSS